MAREEKADFASMAKGACEIHEENGGARNARAKAALAEDGSSCPSKGLPRLASCSSHQCIPEFREEKSERGERLGGGDVSALLRLVERLFPAGEAARLKAQFLGGEQQPHQARCWAPFSAKRPGFAAEEGGRPPSGSSSEDDLGESGCCEALYPLQAPLQSVVGSLLGEDEGRFRSSLLKVSRKAFDGTALGRCEPFAEDEAAETESFSVGERHLLLRAALPLAAHKTLGKASREASADFLSSFSFSPSPPPPLSSDLWLTSLLRSPDQVCATALPLQGRGALLAATLGATRQAPALRALRAEQCLRTRRTVCDALRRSRERLLAISLEVEKAEAEKRRRPRHLHQQPQQQPSRQASRLKTESAAAPLRCEHRLRAKQAAASEGRGEASVSRVEGLRLLLRREVRLAAELFFKANVLSARAQALLLPSLPPDGGQVAERSSETETTRAEDEGQEAFLLHPWKPPPPLAELPSLLSSLPSSALFKHNCCGVFSQQSGVSCSISPADETKPPSLSPSPAPPSPRDAAEASEATADDGLWHSQQRRSSRRVVFERLLPSNGVEQSEPPTDGDWRAEAVAWDGFRSAFLVDLRRRPQPPRQGAASVAAAAMEERRVKVFSCLRRSRVRTGAIVSTYVGFRRGGRGRETGSDASSEDALLLRVLSDAADSELGDSELSSAEEEVAAGGTSPLRRETSRRRAPPVADEAPCASGGGRSLLREKEEGAVAVLAMLEAVKEELCLWLIARQRAALEAHERRLLQQASRQLGGVAASFSPSPQTSQLAAADAPPFPLSSDPWKLNLLSSKRSEEALPHQGGPKTTTPPTTNPPATTQPTPGGVGVAGRGPAQIQGLSGEEAPADEEGAALRSEGRAEPSPSAGSEFLLDAKEIQQRQKAATQKTEGARPLRRLPVSSAPYECRRGESETLTTNADSLGVESSSAKRDGEEARPGSSAETLQTGEGKGRGEDEGGSLQQQGRRDSWVLRVLNRERGDVWQLRVAAATKTTGCEDVREAKSAAGGSLVDFELSFESRERREAALEVLEGMTPPSSLFAGGAGSEAERKKELKILYDSLLEPAFAIQADDRVVKVRDPVVSIFSLPELYISLHCLLTWDQRLQCLAAFFAWICGVSDDVASWRCSALTPAMVERLMEVAVLFREKLGSFPDPSLRELPSDDAALLQRNRALIQLYVAHDQRREGAASGGGSTALPEAASPSSSWSWPCLRDEVLQVPEVGPVDFALPDGVKFDKSKLAFRCLWREGGASAAAAAAASASASAGGGGSSRVVGGIPSPKTSLLAGGGAAVAAASPSAASPCASQHAASSSAAGGVAASRSAASPSSGGVVVSGVQRVWNFGPSQSRSRTFSCRKYGLFQSRLLAMQARLAAELLVPQAPPTSRYRLACLPAVVAGLLPLPEPVDSPVTAVEGVCFTQEARRARQLSFQRLVMQQQGAACAARGSLRQTGAVGGLSFSCSAVTGGASSSRQTPPPLDCEEAFANAASLSAAKRRRAAAESVASRRSVSDALPSPKFEQSASAPPPSSVAVEERAFTTPAAEQLLHPPRADAVQPEAFLDEEESSQQRQREDLVVRLEWRPSEEGLLALQGARQCGAKEVVEKLQSLVFWEPNSREWIAVAKPHPPGEAQAASGSSEEPTKDFLRGLRVPSTAGGLTQKAALRVVEKWALGRALLGETLCRPSEEEAASSLQQGSPLADAKTTLRKGGLFFEEDAEDRDRDSDEAEEAALVEALLAAPPSELLFAVGRSEAQAVSAGGSVFFGKASGKQGLSPRRDTSCPGGGEASHNEHGGASPSREPLLSFNSKMETLFAEASPSEPKSALPRDEEAGPASLGEVLSPSLGVRQIPSAEQDRTAVVQGEASFVLPSGAPLIAAGGEGISTSQPPHQQTLLLLSAEKQPGCDARCSMAASSDAALEASGSGRGTLSADRSGDSAEILLRSATEKEEDAARVSGASAADAWTS